MKNLRKLIGKSQEDFAAMLGVSLDTIGSVEIGRNGLTRKLDRRIVVTTGASLFKLVYKMGTGVVDVPMPDGEVRNVCENGPYTLETFERHRKKFASTSNAAKELLEEAIPTLRRLFLAAAVPGKAGIRDRLPGLYFSLHEWMQEQNRLFKLGVNLTENEMKPMNTQKGRN